MGAGVSLPADSHVPFGSDAHEPDRVADGFAVAAAVAEANGFRPAADPLALWTRS